MQPDSEPGSRRGTVELVCVDDEATRYGTFQSHNQKVVSNRHGIFLTFFSHNNTFHVVGLDGKVRKRVQLLQRGKNALLQYPLLDMAPNGTVHAAWTTQQHGVYMYWDIHHMLSRDGGDTWQNLDGTKLTLPVIADDTGPATRITWDDEFEYHSWLSSFRVKNGKLHFAYLAQRTPPRQHCMRYDIATAERDYDLQPTFAGKTVTLTGLDGFFATRSDQPDSPLYCVMQDAGHLACLISRDHGETWHDYAKSEEKFQPYSIGGFREITDDGYIVGSFTDPGSGPQSLKRDAKVYFFRIQTGWQGHGTRQPDASKL